MSRVNEVDVIDTVQSSFEKEGINVAIGLNHHYVLKAELSYLTSPSRLKRLNNQYHDHLRKQYHLAQFH